jgi:hypothetical protein
MGSAVAVLAGAARVVAAVCLLGSVLLIAALVGQGVAGAVEPVAPAAGVAAGSASASAAAAARTPVGRFNALMANAETLVGKTAAPVVPAARRSGSQPAPRRGRNPNVPNWGQVPPPGGSRSQVGGQGAQAAPGSGPMTSDPDDRGPALSRPDDLGPPAAGGPPGVGRPLPPGPSGPMAQMPARSQVPHQVGTPQQPIDYPGMLAGSRAALIGYEHGSKQTWQQIPRVLTELRMNGFGYLFLELLPQDTRVVNPDVRSAVKAYIQAHEPDPELAELKMVAYDMARWLGFRVRGVELPESEVLRLPGEEEAPPWWTMSPEEFQSRVLHPASVGRRNAAFATSMQWVLETDQDAKAAGLYGEGHLGYGLGPTVNQLLPHKYAPVVFNLRRSDGDPPYPAELLLANWYADALGGAFAMQETGEPRNSDYLLSDPDQLTASGQPTARTPEQATLQATLDAMVGNLNEKRRLDNAQQRDPVALEQNALKREQLIDQLQRDLTALRRSQPGPPPGQRKGSSLEQDRMPQDTTVTAQPPAKEAPAAASLAEHPAADTPAPAVQADTPAADGARTASVFTNDGPVGPGGSDQEPSPVLDARVDATPTGTVAKGDGDGSEVAGELFADSLDDTQLTSLEGTQLTG